MTHAEMALDGARIASKSLSALQVGNHMHASVRGRYREKRRSEALLLISNMVDLVET